MKAIAKKTFPKFYETLVRVKNAIYVPTISTIPTTHKSNRAKLHNVARFLYYRRVLKLVDHLDGTIVECGVGHGFSLVSLLSVMLSEGPKRAVWGFDSFEGFPEPSIQDVSARKVTKGHYHVPIDIIKDLLHDTDYDLEQIDQHLTLVKGFFSDTLSSYDGGAIAFLHIDADLYQSYLDVFHALYDQVVVGGVIALDEYMDPSYPGARLAVDEFLVGKNATLQRDPLYGKYYIIKG